MSIVMKIFYTEKNVSAPVRSALARMSRKSRGAWNGIQFNSPEDFCNQLLEAQRIERQK